MKQQNHMNMHQEFTNAMHSYRTSADPKEQLWQAVHYGDYAKFKELADARVQLNINEYRFGITLLHALVLSDRCDEDDEAIYANKQQIARHLLQLGADLDAPAEVDAPWPIQPGQTPWQMAKRFDALPWFHL